MIVAELLDFIAEEVKRKVLFLGAAEYKETRIEAACQSALNSQTCLHLLFFFVLAHIMLSVSGQK